MAASATQYPKDLARLLIRSLGKEARRQVDLATACAVVECAYFASMRSEEGRPVVCTFAFANPRIPDPSPPEFVRHHRQRFFPFRKRMPLSLRNVAKIAPIANTSALAIAVYGDPNTAPYIWGLVDQEYHHRRARVFEDDSSFGRAGVFQVEAEGAGNVAVFADNDFVGSLRGGTITTVRLDALHDGPVFNSLFDQALKMYFNVVDDLGAPFVRDFRLSKESEACFMDSIDSWIGSICRLLHRIQRYHHGGALLLLPDTDRSDLNIKYAMKYSRLGDVLAKRVASTAAKEHLCNRAHEAVENQNPIDPDDYHQERQERFECDDARHATDGAVAFIAALSQVDGLIVMGPGLAVQGFGAEIRTKRGPKYVYAAGDERGTLKVQRRVEVTSFGTRHRSMFRYCNEHPGAVGFVVSQDGDIRAITKAGNRVLMWEDLNLYNYEHDAFRKRAARSARRTGR